MFKLKMKDSFLKKALVFKKISSSYPIPEAHKLFILQVYAGLKKAGSFDGFFKKDTKIIKQIQLLLEDLKMHYKLLDMSRNVKILFSMRKQDTLKLFDIHRKVFRENKRQDEYGKLLGYPGCCISRFMSGRNQPRLTYPFFPDIKNRISNYKLFIDYRLNRFCEYNVISHQPCKSDCPQTIILVNRILRAYKAYDSVLTEKIIASLKKPVLIFNPNNFIKFYDILKNNTIYYSRIDHVNPSFCEQGSITREDSVVNIIIKFIQSGNKIVFKRGYFAVFKGNTLLAKNYAFQRPYLLFVFK